MPVQTSGAESMCGVRALTISLLAAIEALSITNVDTTLINVANFKKLIKGDRYKALVAEHLDKTYTPETIEQTKLYRIGRLPPGTPYEEANDWKAEEGGYNEQLESMTHPDYLEINQLQLLMEIVNEELGTCFRLGHLTQGYWSKWVPQTKSFDRKLHETSISVDEEMVGAPAIFIYNNNAANIAARRNVP
jgi:hypothetical protein